MNIPHEKFCVLPWVSLEASPIGTVRPCCLAKNEITDRAGNKFNLNNASLDDIRYSKDMQQLRNDFLDAKLPEVCQRCWSEEDANRVSKRMHTLDRLKDILKNETEWTTSPKELYFMDLKLGNICNLKCRICGSWSSSTYAAEELKSLPMNQRKHSFHKEMMNKGAWPRQNTNFWDELNAHVYSIQYLEFTGGEPFLIQEHFNFLNTLINMKVAHNIEIHYNTNGTIYPEQAESIWRNFKHVEIAFSIDAIEERFEYQRTGARWLSVQENLEKFKNYRSCNDNITLQVCCTISIFNVYYLEEVADWIDRQGFDFIYWNMLHDSLSHNIISLPSSVKTIIYKRLRNANTIHIKEFMNAAEFMMQRTGEALEVILNDIKKVDSRRNHSLYTAHKELADLLGYAKA